MPLDPVTMAALITGGANVLGSALAPQPQAQPGVAPAPAGAQPAPNIGETIGTPAAPAPLSILNDEMLTQVAQAAANAVKGPPAPSANLQGTREQKGPPAPEQPQMSIGEILSAAPQAIANVAPLLGLGPEQATQQFAAPIPGGTQGAVVPGFNLPQGVNLNQLLAQIPGLR